MGCTVFYVSVLLKFMPSISIWVVSENDCQLDMSCTRVKHTFSEKSMMETP